MEQKPKTIEQLEKEKQELLETIENATKAAKDATTAAEALLAKKDEAEKKKEEEERKELEKKTPEEEAEAEAEAKKKAREEEEKRKAFLGKKGAENDKKIEKWREESFGLGEKIAETERKLSFAADKKEKQTFESEIKELKQKRAEIIRQIRDNMRLPETKKGDFKKAKISDRLENLNQSRETYFQAYSEHFSKKGWIKKSWRELREKVGWSERDKSLPLALATLRDKYQRQKNNLEWNAKNQLEAQGYTPDEIEKITARYRQLNLNVDKLAAERAVLNLIRTEAFDTQAKKNLQKIGRAWNSFGGSGRTGKIIRYTTKFVLTTTLFGAIGLGGGWAALGAAGGLAIRGAAIGGGIAGGWVAKYLTGFYNETKKKESSIEELTARYEAGEIGLAKMERGLVKAGLKANRARMVKTALIMGSAFAGGFAGGWGAGHFGGGLGEGASESGPPITETPQVTDTASQVITPPDTALGEGIADTAQVVPDTAQAVTPIDTAQVIPDTAQATIPIDTARIDTIPVATPDSGQHIPAPAPVTPHAPTEAPEQDVEHVWKPGRPITPAPAPEPAPEPQQPPGVPVEHNPDALVGKGEGIEHALRRQIEHNTDIAKALGWDGKQDLHSFSGRAAHLLAGDKGYVNLATGEEVRMAVPGEIEYQIHLSPSGGEPEILEIKAGEMTEVHQAGAPFEKDLEKYEYHHKGDEIPKSAPAGGEKVPGGSEEVKNLFTGQDWDNVKKDNFVEFYKQGLNGQLTDPEELAIYNHLHEAYLTSLNQDPGNVPSLETLSKQAVTVEDMAKTLNATGVPKEVPDTGGLEKPTPEKVLEQKPEQPKAEPAQKGPALMISEIIERNVNEDFNKYLDKFFGDHGTKGVESNFWQQHKDDKAWQWMTDDKNIPEGGEKFHDRVLEKLARKSDLMPTVGSNMTLGEYFKIMLQKLESVKYDKVISELKK